MVQRLASIQTGSTAIVCANSSGCVYPFVHRNSRWSACSVYPANRCESQLSPAVGMQQYLYPQNYLWATFAAAAVLSALPITIVLLLAQRWLVGVWRQVVCG